MRALMHRKGPNYGIDAPPGIKWLSVWAAAGWTLAILTEFSLLPVTPRLGEILLNAGFWTGVYCTIIAAAMVFSSKVGKLLERDKLLAQIRWQGDERVLDIGCGRGLLLIGAAKKASRGRATGIDIWKTVDLSGNNPGAARLNAVLEGVEKHVDILSADARSLPFAGNSFDIILSNFVLHNIHGKGERLKALQEIARVLAPGGRVILADIFHTGEYSKALSASGLAEVSRSGLRFLVCPPARRVIARKPPAFANPQADLDEREQRMLPF